MAWQQTANAFCSRCGAWVPPDQAARQDPPVCTHCEIIDVPVICCLCKTRVSASTLTIKEMQRYIADGRYVCPKCKALRSLKVPTKKITGICAYCGRMAHLTRDHVIPKTRGVSGGPLVLVCEKCNTSKASKSLYEWLETFPPDAPQRSFVPMLVENLRKHLHPAMMAQIEADRSEHVGASMSRSDSSCLIM